MRSICIDDETTLQLFLRSSIGGTYRYHIRTVSCFIVLNLYAKLYFKCAKARCPKHFTFKKNQRNMISATLSANDVANELVYRENVSGVE